MAILWRGPLINLYSWVSFNQGVGQLKKTMESVKKQEVYNQIQATGTMLEMEEIDQI